MKTYNLLSLDWDYFFPMPHSDPHGLYDWGHRESPFFINDIWTLRAAGFLRRDLPLPPADPLWQTFWERIDVAKRATLYLSESHAMACHSVLWNKVHRADDVAIWSYDAHHDLGYHHDAIAKIRAGQIECGSWLLAYHLHFQPTIRVRYPTWKQHAFVVESDVPVLPDGVSVKNISRRIVVPDDLDALPVFDDIFVCRSGAWTPPWLDNAFYSFVAQAPVRTITALDVPNFPLVNREWDEVEARLYAEREAHAIAQIEAAKAHAGATS